MGNYVNGSTKDELKLYFPNTQEYQLIPHKTLGQMGYIHRCSTTKTLALNSITDSKYSLHLVKPDDIKSGVSFDFPAGRYVECITGSNEIDGSQVGIFADTSNEIYKGARISLLAQLDGGATSEWIATDSDFVFYGGLLPSGHVFAMLANKPAPTFQEFVRIWKVFGNGQPTKPEVVKNWEKCVRDVHAFDKRLYFQCSNSVIEVSPEAPDGRSIYTMLPEDTSRGITFIIAASRDGVLMTGYPPITVSGTATLMREPYYNLRVERDGKSRPLNLPPVFSALQITDDTALLALRPDFQSGVVADFQWQLATYNFKTEELKVLQTFAGQTIKFSSNVGYDARILRPSEDGKSVYFNAGTESLYRFHIATRTTQLLASSPEIVGSFIWNLRPNNDFVVLQKTPPENVPGPLLRTYVADIRGR